MSTLAAHALPAMPAAGRVAEPVPGSPLRLAHGPGASVANGAIALAVFLGGFVIIEPAPYELFLAALLVIAFLFGMRVSKDVLPLLFIFTVFCFGGIISTFMVPDYKAGLIYMAVSYFLALTSVFFANVIRIDMAFLRIIFRAYVVGAVITSMLGIIGYFGAIPGFEVFTRYSRAMGAFQDPNVYGPFLAAPILYLIYGIVNRSPSLIPVRAAALVILLLGLFLAFSRAAWGLAVIASAAFYLLLVINEQSSRIRLKYIVLAVTGVVAILLLLAIALQFEQVSNLFSLRAKAVQSYDGGRIGRFARHLIGYELALSKPWGVGPLEFGKIYGEDTHNIYLKSLMDYGWIGFVSWMTMMLWTLIGGFKLLFRQRPWLPYLQIAYMVFLGHCIIGNVIDIDRWRHVYLMIGIIWGCMALEAQWQRDLQAAGARPREDPSRKPQKAVPASKGRPVSLLDRMA